MALGKQVEENHKMYRLLIREGVCREQARMILPQNLYTEYYGTVNLSNLLKFIDLRIHEGAQWEIQKVAEALLEMATDRTIGSQLISDCLNISVCNILAHNKLDLCSS